MDEKYRFDNLDLKIIETLQRDSRTPYLEIARNNDVAGGTIHQRMDKIKKSGAIKGFTIEVDYKKLGYGVTCLLGILLNSAGDVPRVSEKLKSINQVTEIYYTTGKYALFIKTITRSIDELHDFLVTKLQRIDGVQSTETFICLDTPLKRNLKLD